MKHVKVMKTSPYLQDNLIVGGHYRACPNGKLALVTLNMFRYSDLTCLQSSVRIRATHALKCSKLKITMFTAIRFTATQTPKSKLAKNIILPGFTSVKLRKNTKLQMLRVSSYSLVKLTYHEAELLLVLDLASTSTIGHLLGKDNARLEEKDVTLAPFLNQLLHVPHREGFLQQYLAC
jgi:hypothetical protein